MKEYGKIETLFKRDEAFKVTEELKNPVFKTINPWIVTEKIDGINVRVHLTADNEVKIGGRTDKAPMAVDLMEHLQSTLTAEKLMALRLDEDPVEITLYGEGYGPGIRKGGGRYRKDKSFILFDVLIDGEWWLEDKAVTEVANKLGINRVPVIGTFNFDEIVSIVKSGLGSRAAEDKELMAEGIVARPIQPLFDRRKKRVIMKLKTKDFS